MGSFRQFLPVCAVLIVAAAAPLRADFIATASLNAAADKATNSTGVGSATVDWMAATDTFTYTLSWSNLTGPAAMAHIHFGAAGVAGPVVIPFFMASSPSGDLPATDSISGTLTAANFVADPAGGINTIADVATAIQMGDAYANIHTSAYPAGELRGQFAVSSATPEPATAGLVFLSSIAGIVALARKRRAIAAPAR